MPSILQQNSARFLSFEARRSSVVVLATLPTAVCTVFIMACPPLCLMLCCLPCYGHAKPLVFLAEHLADAGHEVRWYAFIILSPKPNLDYRCYPTRGTTGTCHEHRMQQECKDPTCAEVLFTSCSLLLLCDHHVLAAI